MPNESKKYDTVLEEAAALQLSLLRIAALFRARTPEVLKHIPRTTIDKAIVASTIFLKTSSLEFDSFSSADADVFTPISSLEKFLLDNAEALGINRSDAHPLLEFLTSSVFSSEKMRRYAPFASESGKEKAFQVATLAEDSIALSPKFILDLARFRDLEVIAGIEMLDFRTYRVKMAITNREADKVIAELQHIQSNMQLEARYLAAKTAEVRKQFDSVDFEKIQQDIFERVEKYDELNKRSQECRDMLDDMSDVAAKGELDAMEQTTVDKARGMLDSCIASYSQLAAQTRKLYEEIGQAAERYSRYDASEMYDFGEEVVGRLDKLNAEAIAELPFVFLFPFVVDKHPAELLPMDVLVDFDLVSRRRTPAEFVDMSEIEVVDDGDPSDTPQAHAAKRLAEAIETSAKSHGGTTTISKMYLEYSEKDPEMFLPGAFHGAIFERLLGNAKPPPVAAASVLGPFTYEIQGREFRASDIEFEFNPATNHQGGDPK